jgi:gas vesicle protein
MENSNNSGKVIGALLLGAAIGGVLGILFAPDKGSSTRKKIFDQGADLGEAVKDKFNEFVDQSKRGFQSAKDKATDVAMEGRERFESAKEKANEFKANAKTS